MEDAGRGGAGEDQGRRGSPGPRAGPRDAALSEGPGRLVDLASRPPTRRPGQVMTDVKFGILLWSQAATWDEMLDAAKRVDRLGYAHLWTWDHLYAIFGDPYQDIFDGYPLLAAWARETHQTRL